MIRMTVAQRRRLAHFLSFAEPIIDVSCVLVMVLFCVQFMPKELFNTTPATGGDTGSHFWTFYGLYEYGLPQGGVRVWNPGNHAGEPRLLHYFPLPFLVMSLLAAAVPVGTAYNIGTVLGTILFPFACYFCLRGMRLRFPVPVIGAALAHFTHYNESFSMWGGNTLSTLAGQFAHSYAFVVLLFGIGALGWELRRGRFPLFAPLLFSAVFISHGYPALGIPFILAAFLLFYPFGSFITRFWGCFWTGLFSLLLSLWFIVPMRLNASWQTKHDLNWTSSRFLDETFPSLMREVTLAFQWVLGVGLFFWVLRRFSALRVSVAALTAVSIVVADQLVYGIKTMGDVVKPPSNEIPVNIAVPTTLITRFEQLTSLSPRYVPLVIAALGTFLAVFYGFGLFRRWFQGPTRRIVSFGLLWLIPTLWFLYLYYLLPYAELINIRAVPQVQLFALIGMGVILGLLVQQMGRTASVLVVLPLVLVIMWRVGTGVKNFPGWLQWNLSGWTSKPLYSTVTALSDSIKGNFSDPRVIYELSSKADPTGTIRVWEMLPYFAGRATLESVYLEATLMSGEAVYLQAEISKFPSCPLPQYPCPRYDLAAVVPRLKLMGVGSLILANDETKNQARTNGFYNERGTFGPWTVFDLKEQPTLVEVFQHKPILEPSDNWRLSFYEWFTHYTGTQPFVVAAEKLPAKVRASLEESSASSDDIWTRGVDCHPKVDVVFNKITLTTDCPGRAHYLKFNYHPAWRTSTGDEMFIVGPAFIGVIPSAETVVFEFGHHPIWKATAFISYGAAVILALFHFSPIGDRLMWKRQ